MDEPPSIVFLEIFPGFGLIHFVSFIAIGIFLFLSGAVSASEVAFFSLSGQDIERCRNKRDTISTTIVELASRPRLLLATILIMNNLLNVAIITMATFLMWELTGTLNPEELIVGMVTFSATFLIAFFGEIIPKVYATKYNMTFARSTAAVWKILIILCKPISSLLLKMGSLVESRFEKKGYHTTVEELNQALEIAAGNSESTEDEKGILKGIVNFGTLTAKQIMSSRPDISAADVEMNFVQLLAYINKSGFSRLPVFRETLDRIEGILYIKDLLPFIDQHQKFEWQKLLRPGFFIPETKKIDSLLKDFQAKRVHLAIVVDEYGGTSGLITLEDVIEEIIGEINDEFDEEGMKFQKLDNETFLFEGKVSLHDLSKALEVPVDTFDKVKGDSESLGGLILELHHKLPRSGQYVNFGEYTFIVESADRRRIKRVKVHRKPKVGQSKE